MSRDDVEKIVKDFLGAGLVEIGDDGLGPDTKLVSTGRLDSAGLVLLLSFVEKEFGIKFSVEELASAELDSFSSIVDWVWLKVCRDGAWT